MGNKPQFWLRNGHINTIFTSQFRKVADTPFTRERISTPDSDFLDLDWTAANSDKLIVLCHGLEGNSRRPYIQGMVNLFHQRGYDTLAWNYRGCSDEINKTKLFYHSGSTYDLDTVLKHALNKNKNKYNSVFLIGFSMGGNLILKHLGESGHNLDTKIKKAVAISTPMQLKDCSKQLKKGFSKVYTKNFLKTLIEKVHAKKHLLTEYDLTKLNKVKNLEQFDNLLTAPIHGFKNANDYYHKCSSKQNLLDITIPTLIISALDDPFLDTNCYPYEQSKQNKNLNLITPKYGGHNGFCINPFKNEYLSEKLTKDFILP